MCRNNRLILGSCEEDSCMGETLVQRCSYHQCQAKVQTHAGRDVLKDLPGMMIWRAQPVQLHVA